MARKGTSIGEKLRKLSAFFTAAPEIYSMKELEKKLPKACGVSPMAIGDLIKEALDENVIRCEKVGANNVYWSFPKQEMHFYACENEKMQLAIAEYKGEIKKRREHLEKMRVAKEDSVERRSLISKYRQLKARMEEVEKLRWAADNCSVSQYKDMERQMEDTKKNINKVMDDIFSLQSYVCNKCNMDKKEFNSAFGLKEDMDYVE